MTRQIGLGPAGGGGPGVVSFNGRVGAVTSSPGDYTAADVSALALTGGTMSGAIAMGGNQITGLSDVLTALVNGSTIEDTATTAVKARRNPTTAINQVPSAPITGLGWVTHVTANFNVTTAALYRVDVGGLATGSASNTQLQGRVLVDGAADLGGPLQTYGLAGGVYALAGNLAFAFAPGAHTVEVQFQLPGGPGNFVVDVSAAYVYTED